MESIPMFQDGEDYSLYRQAVVLWDKATASMPPHKRGPGLVLALKGNIRAVMLEPNNSDAVMDAGDLQANFMQRVPNDPNGLSLGVSKFLEIMDGYFKKDALDTEYEDIMKFIHARRTESDMTLFLNRWTVLRDKALAHIGRGALSPQIVSVLLLNAAMLKEDDRKIVMALATRGSSSGERGALSDTAEIIHHLKRQIKNTSPVKPVNAAFACVGENDVLMVDNERSRGQPIMYAPPASQSQDESAAYNPYNGDGGGVGGIFFNNNDQRPPEEPWGGDEYEAAKDFQYAYANVMKKKRRLDKVWKGQLKRNKKGGSAHFAKGKGKGKTQGGNPINRITGKKLTCYRCGSPEHLLNACDQPEQAFELEGEESEEEEAIAAFCDFWQVNTLYPSPSCLSLSHMPSIFSVDKSSPGDSHFIIDTGATASISSMKWVKSHSLWLSEKGMDPPVWIPSRRQFRFGNNNVTWCDGVVRTKFAVGGKWREFEVHIFSVNVPNLLSVRGLAAIGGLIDINNSCITMGDGSAINLINSSNGHLLVDVHEDVEEEANVLCDGPPGTTEVIYEGQDNYFNDCVLGSEQITYDGEVDWGGTEPENVDKSFLPGVTDGTNVVEPVTVCDTPAGVDGTVPGVNGLESVGVTVAVPDSCDTVCVADGALNAEPAKSCSHAAPDDDWVDDSGFDIYVAIALAVLATGDVEKIFAVVSFEKGQMWTENGSPSEIFTAVTLQEFRKATGNRLYQIVKSIHERWGHMPAAQLRKHLSGVPGLPDCLWKTVDKVVDDCDVCWKWHTQPPIPGAGTRTATHFNDHIEMDLLFHAEWIFLHVVDVHTHYNAMKIVPSKRSAEVLAAFRECWLMPYGIPTHVTLDSGGEFTSNAYGDEFSSMGILPHYKPKGSHAFIIENMHVPIRKTILKIFEDPLNDWGMDRILVDVLRVVNNTIGKGGFSPCQAVFGHAISDPASVLIGGEDAHPSDTFLQDTNEYGPFVQAMRLREVACAEIHRAMNEQRVQRLLAHSNQYKNERARVGDVVAYYKSAGGKDEKKSEARWAGPADLIHIFDGIGIILVQNHRTLNVPLHLLRVWKPGIENTPCTEKNEDNEMMPVSSPQTGEMQVENDSAPMEAGGQEPEMGDASGDQEWKKFAAQISSHIDPKDIPDPGDLRWNDLQKWCAKLGYRGAYKKDVMRDYVKERRLGNVAKDHAEALQRKFVEEKDIIKEHHDSEDIEFHVIREIEKVCKNPDLIYGLTALAADKVIKIAGSTLTSDDCEKFHEIIMLAKKAEIDQIISHDAVKTVKKTAVTGTTISMKWVMTWKECEECLPGLPPFRKIKARLVARGFEDPAQQNGHLINTARMALRGSNQVLLSIAALKGWHLRKLDVQAAFLKSDYMQRNLWLVPPRESGVKDDSLWKCKKAIYGLSDAPSEFHRTMSDYILKEKTWQDDLGLQIVETELDKCLYTAWRGDDSVGMLSTHVDDILIAGEARFINEFIRTMELRFGVLKKEQAPFHHCGVRISEQKGGFVLDQNEYCDRLEPVQGAYGEEDDLVSESVLDAVRTQIGKLTYMTYGTRPDLAAKVGDLATRVTKFKVRDVALLNSTIAYAKKNAPALKYLIHGDFNLEKIHLNLFTDCAFGGDEGKSRTGCVVTLSDGFPNGAFQVLHWGSRVLRRVARSTVAGELMAALEHTQTVEHLKLLYSEVFLGAVGANLITDCENMFAHVKNGRDPTEKALIKPFAQLKELLSMSIINNMALISGLDNPADPLTKGDRAQGAALRSLMSSQTLPRIGQFRWLKSKP